MRVRVSLLAVLVISIAGGFGGCGGSGPRNVDPPGTFSLDWMGYEDQILKPGESQFASAKVSYALPKGAKQGGRTWFKIRLHYRLTIAPNSGPGTITVIAATNDDAGMAAIDFRTVRRNGQLEVTSSSVGLVEGRQRVRRSKLIWDSTFSNFLLYSGVRPGTNTLRFTVIRVGEARVDSLRVYKDTALVVDARGPSAVEIVPRLNHRDIRVGEQFTVDYVVRNSGGVPLPAGGRVTVSVPPAVQVLGQQSQPLGRVAVGETTSGQFRLIARRPGNHAVSLTASTWGGSPIAKLAVHVVQRGAKPAE